MSEPYDDTRDDAQTVLDIINKAISDLTFYEDILKKTFDMGFCIGALEEARVAVKTEYRLEDRL